jgi:hypothetical protein
VAVVERDVCGVFEGRSKPVSRRRHNGILARFNLPHVDADFTPDHHTILGGAPRDSGGIGARYQGLGRGAAGIDASPADEMALNDSHLHPGPAKRNAKDGPAWPVPMMIASKSGMTSRPSSRRCHYNNQWLMSFHTPGGSRIVKRIASV